jgi:hypothetical protein
MEKVHYADQPEPGPNDDSTAFNQRPYRKSTRRPGMSHIRTRPTVAEGPYSGRMQKFVRESDYCVFGAKLPAFGSKGHHSLDR